jgi:hypothetical protein
MSFISTSILPPAFRESRPSVIDDLVVRLAARIATATEEISPFSTESGAFDAIADRFFRDRRVVIARPTRESLAARAWAAARTARETAWLGASGDVASAGRFGGLDGLIDAAREADTLGLTSPFAPNGRSAGALSPRELLQLRSRAPRPTIVLDLLDEELAASPLTQPALLLPGTIILRGFGELWRDVGARRVAGIAFAAGPAELIGTLRDADFPESLARDAVRDLDQRGIDRAVQARAAAARVPFAGYRTA